MSTKNSLLLILLSAIWGGSFIFMRVLAPVFGAVGTANIRLLIGAIFLLTIYRLIRYQIHWKRDWKLFLVIGIINSALPFTFFSFAALHIPASISVVINSMTPMFGALFEKIILKGSLTINKLMGLVIGTIGVIIISGSKTLSGTPKSYVAIFACLAATFCYGLSGALVKKYGKQVEAKAMAGGSQLFAGFVLLPFLATSGFSTPVTYDIILTVIVFGVLCSAIAYLIYYHLINTAGPTIALSVTFLMPVFGILWSKIILNEVITGQMILGAFIILIGIYLIIKPKSKKVLT